MPRERSIKQLLCETVIFISMFVLAGHLSINFWEKYVIQSELSHMKCSLYNMKKTINNIGNEYDNIYKELKNLKQITKNVQQPKERVHRHKNIYNQKAPNNAQLHTAVAKYSNKSCSTPNNEERNNQTKGNKQSILSNATTMTKNPVQTRKIGADLESAAEEENFQYVICNNKLRNCCKKCNKCKPDQNHGNF